MPPLKLDSKAGPAKGSTSAGRARVDARNRNESHLIRSHTIQSESGVENRDPSIKPRAPRTLIDESILPLEILVDIFMLVLPTAQELRHRVRADIRAEKKSANPFVFCAVCPSWRFIALSTPQLWQNVLIHIPPGLQKALAKKQAAGLVRWIERSRPLSPTLYISRDIIRDINRFLSWAGPEAPILSVLDRYAARWESIYSQGLPWFRFDGWFSLRRICLSQPNRVLYRSTNKTTPWKNLTHLQIQSYMSCQEAELTLRKCPKLVWLSIIVYPTFHKTIAPITMHDLVTFSLNMCYSTYLGQFVPRLSLPSLREFSIKGFSPEDIKPLLNLFTRSRCTLDKLEMHGSRRFPLRNYLNVLSHRSCASLSSLAIHDATCYYFNTQEESCSEMIQRLTLHRSDTLCARLESLTIDCCTATSSRSEVLNMVESRLAFHGTSRTPDEPVLHYLQLHYLHREEDIAKIQEVGMRNGMEYDYEKSTGTCSLVWLQRQGFRKPSSFGELTSKSP